MQSTYKEILRIIDSYLIWKCDLKNIKSNLKTAKFIAHKK